MNLKQEGDNVTLLIKQASWFPFRNGKVKFQATKGELFDPTTYKITFDCSVAPYIEYLEEGTSPHNIMNAFGRTYNADGSWNFWFPFGDGIAYPFGIGGRFSGRFHPGSTKHKGFIKDKSVNAIIEYFVNKYKGELR